MAIGVLLLDDSKTHATALKEGLEDGGKFTVVVYRDLLTLKAAIASSALQVQFGGSVPDVLVLDVMLARDLGLDEPEAPRWTREESIPLAEVQHYRDDDLGLAIVTELREGLYAPLPRGLPVIVITARNNWSLMGWVSAHEPIVLLRKPVYTDEVAEAIRRALPEATALDEGDQ